MEKNEQIEKAAHEYLQDLGWSETDIEYPTLVRYGVAMGELAIANTNDASLYDDMRIH